MSELKFKDMIFYRDSEAWCPVTGKHVIRNQPRVASNYILEHIAEPKIYYKFPDTQGYTAYSVAGYTRPGETTHYLVDLMNEFETNVPTANRVVLGVSEQGRNIEAFRLGPINKKHFVLSCVIHGNETDGLTGSFKGMEILMTHPDFASLREEFTLFFMPCNNPDGHFNYTRGVAKYGPHPSGVDQLINLNRVWPWFWTEFVPSESESKGTVPLDCLSAQAIYNYFTEGNSGGPVPIGFMLDQHATMGDGARYQSRDRCFREISEYDWKSIYAEWIIYRQLRGMQSKRVFDDAMPDLFVLYFRSRWKPHFHTWVSTLTKEENGGVAPISMVSEHNKVLGILAYTDKETYQSACNYNMDYVLAAGTIMLNNSVLAKSAVLIEHEVGNNQVNNSDFEQWQKKSDELDPIDYRPGYWTPNRLKIKNYNFRNKHMDYHGSMVGLAPELIIELPDGYNVGPDGYHDVMRDPLIDYKAYILSNINTGGISLWVNDQSSTTGGLTNIFSDNSASTNHEYRIIDFNTNYYIIDLGKLPSDNTKLLRYSPVGVKTELDSYGAPLVSAGIAKTFLSKAYIIGGKDGVGSFSKKVLIADTSLETISELGSNLLTTGDSGFSAEYCVGGTLDGKIVIIGGENTFLSGLKIVTIDPSIPSEDETILSVSGTTLPKDIINHATSYDGIDTIWIYGGESPISGEIYGKVWTLTFNGSSWSILEKTLLAGLDEDGEKEDYSGDSEWFSRRSNWKSTRMRTYDDDAELVILLGGKYSIDGYSIEDIDYNDFYVHDVADTIITKTQDNNFGYTRYNLSFQTGGLYDKVSATWSVKAADSSTTAYCRINNATGDSVSDIITLRRAWTYYMHPPKWWYRYGSSLDFSNGRKDYNEDEWRAYIRVYRDLQELYVDSPMIQTGTLWPSSWSPSGVVRQSEMAVWENCIDPRWMRVKFVWQPQSSFITLRNDLKLLKITDGNRNLELWASSDGYYKERCYVVNSSYSSSEPYLELRDSDGYVSDCRIPVYWGAHTKDTAMESFPSPLTIEIWQHPEIGTGLIVKNGSATGKTVSNYKFNPSNWQSTANIEILGGGWWAEPEKILLTKKFAMENAYLYQDAYNIFNETNQRRALLLGDCDPTYGKVDATGTYRYIETFNRIDDINLGSYWDVIQQTGNGWDIESNTAKCTSVGWERWDAVPNKAFCGITGTAKINNISSRIGFFVGMDYSMAGAGWVDGYLGSVVTNASSQTRIEIEHFYVSGGIQQRDLVFNSGYFSPSYTLGEEMELSVGFRNNLGSTEVYCECDYGSESYSCSGNTSSFWKAGVFGICGETPDSSSSVSFNDISAFSTWGSIRINQS